MITNLSQLFLIWSFLIFASCTSPTSRIEPKILEFKNKFPDNVEVYQTKNRQMRFAWSGDVTKAPLIFVHGSPGGWEGWSEFLLNRDLQRNFHLIAIDRPGYGGSGAGNTEPSLKKQAEDVISVLRFNKSGQKAILVGHSYGGAVIAQIAIDMPDQVTAVIFVASSVDPDLEKKKWFQYPASWWPIKFLIPKNLRVCNEEIEALKKELEVLSPRWHEMKTQVVTIQGTADTLVPPQNQDFILAHVQGTQVKFVQKIEGMNHFIPWEHPELILNAIAVLKKQGR